MLHDDAALHLSLTFDVGISRVADDILYAKEGRKAARGHIPYCQQIA